MRIERFEGYFHQAIAGAGAPYASVDTFAAAGITDPRFGLIVRLATGAGLHLQLVEYNGPPHEDREVPEEPVTGPSPTPVDVPELPARAPIRIADVDAHLRALVVNAAHPEVASVELRGRAPVGGACQPGIRVTMHSGRVVIVMHRHTLRPGDHPGEAHQPRAQV